MFATAAATKPAKILSARKRIDSRKELRKWLEQNVRVAMYASQPNWSSGQANLYVMLLRAPKSDKRQW
jgi:hypothetical protein